MKYAIGALALLIVVSLGACKKKERPTPEPELSLEEQIEERILSERAKEIRFDTVVLDFTFGMSKDNVYRHTKKLAGKNKMYRIEKRAGVWEYVYDLRLRKIGKTRTYFDAFYYENKLYKVECLPRIVEGREPMDVIEETLELFVQKYGEPHFEIPAEVEEGEDPSDCVDYLWIDGNRRIEILCDEERAVINYIDMPRAEEAAKNMDI